MDGRFDEYRFKRQVDKALDRVKTTLDVNRNPQYPADVNHTYNDKYLLSSFLANSAISSLFSSFEAIGLNEKAFIQLKEWSQNRSVTLRLRSNEECKFLREETREVKSDAKDVCY